MGKAKVGEGAETAGQGADIQQGTRPSALAHIPDSVSNPLDWRVDTFVASTPNPPWEVRVRHIPSGVTRTACGKGDGWRAVVGELKRNVLAGATLIDWSRVAQERERVSPHPDGWSNRAD